MSKSTLSITPFPSVELLMSSHGASEILNFSQFSRWWRRRRRWEENEVCIEKLLETLAGVADGGSQQCFNLMGQR